MEMNALSSLFFVSMTFHFFCSLDRCLPDDDQASFCMLFLYCSSKSLLLLVLHGSGSLILQMFHMIRLHPEHVLLVWC